MSIDTLNKVSIDILYSQLGLQLRRLNMHTDIARLMVPIRLTPLQLSRLSGDRSLGRMTVEIAEIEASPTGE
jgi:hypothetical protein